MSHTHAATLSRSMPTHAHAPERKTASTLVAGHELQRHTLVRFLRGEVPLTDAVIVSLHRVLVDPLLIRRITTAHRAGARLASALPVHVEDPRRLIADPKFDWGPARARLIAL